MGFSVSVDSLSYQVGGGRRKKTILQDIRMNIYPGDFLAILGENGAGKTTILDMLMGFRAPTAGKILIQGRDVSSDNWLQRNNIAYLSEKVDVPGDWSVGDFLVFNRYFYPDYSVKREGELISEFRVDTNSRVGNLSAGEIRRFQAVAALSCAPMLMVIDEITAVLDIIGRRLFMRLIHDINRRTGCTIIIATNIIDDLVNHISRLVILRSGKIMDDEYLPAFLKGISPAEFPQKVADVLEKS